MTTTTTHFRRGGTVVGIPALNESATVADVARAADAGLRLAFPESANVIVLAENGSTDGTVEAFLGAPVGTDQHVIQTFEPNTGKGTNVLALIDYALSREADRLLLLDADLRSAKPQWIGDLALAVDSGEPAMAIPVYRRDRYEAGTTNHLVAPLLAGLFDVRVQQPIGGDFAFNLPFLRRVSEWPRPSSAYLYGIDIWLTSHAIRERALLSEVNLGVKLHTTPFENVLHLPQQVVDSLFHVAVLRASAASRPQRPPKTTARASIIQSSGSPQNATAVANVLAKSTEYLARHEASVNSLFPAARSVIRNGKPKQGCWIDSVAWPDILADAVDAVALGAFTAARDHLIALYVNRLVTFWEEIWGKGSADIDAMLIRQTEAAAHAIQARKSLRGALTPVGFDRGLWEGLVGPAPR